MEHVVTGLFAIQAVAGAALLGAWWRRGSRGAAGVVAHVAPNLTSLVLWVVFTITGQAWWAWGAYFVLNVGTAFGDRMLVGRFRGMQGAARDGTADYGGAIAAVFRGRMPPLVTFHALFSAAVYFSCLGVTIAATIAALS